MRFSGIQFNWKGKKQSKGHIRKRVKANIGKRRTLETKRKMSVWQKGKPKYNQRGEKHGNWKGGNSRYYKEGYWSKEYLRWRLQVFERDSYTCQGCQKVGIYLTAHHIKSWAKYPLLRFDINNGITLCEDCHKLTDNYKGRGMKKTLCVQ